MTTAQKRIRIILYALGEYRKAEHLAWSARVDWGKYETKWSESPRRESDADQEAARIEFVDWKNKYLAEIAALQKEAENCHDVLMEAISFLNCK